MSTDDEKRSGASSVEAFFVIHRGRILEMSILLIDLLILWVSYIAMIFLGTKFIYRSMRKESIDSDNAQHYCVNSGKIDSYKTKHIEDWIMLGGRIIFECLIVVTIAFILLGTRNIRVWWNGMGEYVDKLPIIEFNMWMAIIGLLFVFVSFTQKTWLTFNAYDIINRFDVRSVIVRMGCHILFCSVMYFFKPVLLHFQYSIYFAFRLLVLWAIVRVMCDFIKLIKLLIDSYFSDKMETLFMDSLYRELWNYPVRETSSSEGWNNEAIIKKHANYLIGKALDFSRKIKFDKLSSIDFVMDFCMEAKGGARYKRIRKTGSILFIISWGIYLLLSAITVYSVYGIGESIDAKRDILFPGIIASLTLVIGIGIIFSEKFGYPFCLVFIFTLYGRCGYEFKFESKGKENYKIVSEVPLFNSKYMKFIRSIKNIIAFYMIAPNSAKKSIKEQLMTGYKICTVMCIPLTVIGFIEFLGEKRARIFSRLYKRNSEVTDNRAKAFCDDISMRCMGISREIYLREIEKIFPSKNCESEERVD